MRNKRWLWTGQTPVKPTRRVVDHIEEVSIRQPIWKPWRRRHFFSILLAATLNDFFRVPLDLPSSFEVHLGDCPGQIRYFLQVKIKRSVWKSHDSKIQAFTVVQPMDTNDPVCFRQPDGSVSKETGWFLPSSIWIIRASLPRAQNHVILWL